MEANEAHYDQMQKTTPRSEGKRRQKQRVKLRSGLSHRRLVDPLIEKHCRDGFEVAVNRISFETFARTKDAGGVCEKPAERCRQRSRSGDAYDGNESTDRFTSINRNSFCLQNLVGSGIRGN